MALTITYDGVDVTDKIDLRAKAAWGPLYGSVGTRFMAHPAWPFGTVVGTVTGAHAMVIVDHANHADVIFLNTLNLTGSVPHGPEAVERWEPVPETEF